MSIKVFIVENGEQHEGGSIVGVFLDRDKAIEIALKTRTCFGGGWQKDPDREEDLYWENGCDYVRVEEYQVQE